MTSKEKLPVVCVESVNEKLLDMLGDVGDGSKMETWKKAFPEIEFIETDDLFSGEKIDWSERNTQERLFYVAYMNDPQRTRVEYRIELGGLRERVVISDSEKIWWMWLAGCFRGDDFEEEALKTFLWYATDSEMARALLGDVDIADMVVDGVGVTVSDWNEQKKKDLV